MVSIENKILQTLLSDQGVEAPEILRFLLHEEGGRQVLEMYHNDQLNSARLESDKFWEQVPYRPTGIGLYRSYKTFLLSSIPSDQLLAEDAKDQKERVRRLQQIAYNHGMQDGIKRFLTLAFLLGVCLLFTILLLYEPLMGREPPAVLNHAAQVQLHETQVHHTKYQASHTATYLSTKARSLAEEIRKTTLVETCTEGVTLWQGGTKHTWCLVGQGQSKICGPPQQMLRACASMRARTQESPR